MNSDTSLSVHKASNQKTSEGFNLGPLDQPGFIDRAPIFEGAKISLRCKRVPDERLRSHNVEVCC